MKTFPAFPVEAAPSERRGGRASDCGARRPFPLRAVAEAAEKTDNVQGS